MGNSKFLSSLEIKKNQMFKNHKQKFSRKKTFLQCLHWNNRELNKMLPVFQVIKRNFRQKNSQVAMSGESLLAFTSIEHSCTKYASLCSFKERFSSEFSVRISTFTTTWQSGWNVGYRRFFQAFSIAIDWHSSETKTLYFDEVSFSFLYLF